MRLDDGAVDPARGEVGEGLAHALGGVTEDDVAVLRVVHVRALHPHRQRAHAVAVHRRHEVAGHERDVRLLELRDHPIAIRVEDGARAVDVGHAARLDRVQALEDGDALTHHEHPDRAWLG